MPTLREMMRFLCRCAEQSGHSFSEDLAVELEKQLMKEYPMEKVYIPRPDNSKKAAIVEAAKRLPSGVVAQRYGVTRSWVHRATKKSG